MRALTERPSASEVSVTLTKFGMKRRLVLMLEWLTLWPTKGFLPVNSQRQAMAKILVKSPARRPAPVRDRRARDRSEEHTSELQSPVHLVCRLLLEKKKDALLVAGVLDLSSDLRRAPRSPLFPYTTLFRSGMKRRLVLMLEWLTLWPTKGFLPVNSQRQAMAKILVKSPARRPAPVRDRRARD